ncbi:uncharacterized protein LOC135702662 [Ochlerotatus camptorhynchus]|uniref:uncharacterized protein LOC135702662 n=1 Tax=Ochlerotatus camptorhynchus TaxID=644619 RepID=UPI0031E2E603
MDKTLRLLIKLHGYCTAAACGAFVIWWTWFALDPEQSVGFVKAYNIRYFGIPAVIFGVIWLLSCLLLMIGIFEEKQFLLCPFASMFLIDFGILLSRDVFLVVSESAFDKTVFFNVSSLSRTHLPFVLFIVPNIAFSLLALMRIFRHESDSEMDVEFTVTSSKD